LAIAASSPDSFAASKAAWALATAVVAAVRLASPWIADAFAMFAAWAA
jgi:hypothetical protein